MDANGCLLRRDLYSSTVARRLLHRTKCTISSLAIIVQVSGQASVLSQLIAKDLNSSLRGSTALPEALVHMLLIGPGSNRR